MLRNKKIILNLVWQGVIVWILSCYVVVKIIGNESRIDNQTNDFLIRFLSSSIINISQSERIVYLTIDDKTYNDYFKSNTFDRKLFANGLFKLKRYNPEAVVLDIIFAYPSDKETDSILESAIASCENIYLPISFSLVPDNSNFPLPRNFLPDYIYNKLGLLRQNSGAPFQAIRSIITDSRFLLHSKNFGHISDISDQDGIYRNSLLIIKADSIYIPSLYLAVFLDYLNIKFDEIQIEWGSKIIIPALEHSYNNSAIEIPIDNSGKTRIPFFKPWSLEFENLSFKTFCSLANDSVNQNSLNDFFEGKFVFVGDVSTGVSDLGHTSLNQLSPLITIQSNMLNALLSNTFFDYLKEVYIILFLLVFVTIITIASLFTDIRKFYIALIAALILSTIIILFLLSYRILSPVVSIYGANLFSSLILLIQVQYFTQKEKRSIENDNLQKIHEMNEARKIQMAMLPKEIPISLDFEIATFIRTATFVGGDYYDFFTDNESNLIIVIGDATGHGLKAGTMVTIIKTIFISVGSNFHFNEILNSISRIIKKLKLPQLYMCLLIGKLFNYKLSITSAGMPPVYLYNSQKKDVEKIINKGFPLGSVDNFPYSKTDINLLPNDILVFSSDGLTELLNKNMEMINEEKIIQVINSNHQLSANELLEKFKDLIHSWIGMDDLQDDVTILIIKIK